MAGLERQFGIISYFSSPLSCTEQVSAEIPLCGAGGAVWEQILGRAVALLAGGRQKYNYPSCLCSLCSANASAGQRAELMYLCTFPCLCLNSTLENAVKEATTLFSVL